MDGPMKLGPAAEGRERAIPITPAEVKPEGPTEMNMPGRRASSGNFWVMRR